MTEPNQKSVLDKLVAKGVLIKREIPMPIILFCPQQRLKKRAWDFLDDPEKVIKTFIDGVKGLPVQVIVKLHPSDNSSRGQQIVDRLNAQGNIAVLAGQKKRWWKR